jgi:hypothetical protein
MKAQIKGVYTHAQDGKEYVTRNGNFFCKVLLSLENEKALYESFFFTPKAHFRFEDLFAAAGKVSPDASEISANHLNELIGEEINIAVGKNKAGYDCITKFYPPEIKEQVHDAPTPPVEVTVPDDDLDEDVPF